MLAGNNVHDTNFSVVFCVKTVDNHKNWASDKFAELGDWLIENYNAAIIFAGIPADEETVASIFTSMKFAKNTVNLIGKTDIKQAVAMFREIDLLVTLDTGMGHLAAAAGCQTISLFGSSNFKRYAPAGKNTVIVNSPQRTIETITTQMVQEVITQLVKN